MGKYTPKRYPLNATVPLDLIVQVEELAKARKQPFSRTVEDLIVRGLKDVRREVEELEFARDLEAAKDVDRMKKSLFGGRRRDERPSPK